jgi:hypothetical protein
MLKVFKLIFFNFVLLGAKIQENLRENQICVSKINGNNKLKNPQFRVYLVMIAFGNFFNKIFSNILYTIFQKFDLEHF